MAGPSNEWRQLFERWRNEPAPTWLVEVATTNDERLLIKDAGGLCEAVVTGQICPRGIPEAEHLLNVARGMAAPKTPLQDTIQKCLYRRFAAVRERVDAAQSRALAAKASLERLKKQVEQETSLYVPSESLAQAIDAASEQLASRRSEQDEAKTRCNELRQDIEQHHDPIVERLQQSARTQAKQRDLFADKVSDAKQKLNAVTRLLTRRKARNLLRPGENTEAPPDPDRLVEQRELHELVAAYERQLEVASTELAALKTKLEHATDERDRLRRRIEVTLHYHERSVAEAKRQVKAAQDAVSQERLRVLTAHNGELEQLRRQITDAEQKLNRLSGHSVSLPDATDAHGSVSWAYIDLMISLKSRSADQPYRNDFPACIDTLDQIPKGWSIQSSKFIHECIAERFPCSRQGEPEPAGDRKFKWTVSSEDCDNNQKQRLKGYLDHLARTLQIDCTLDSCTALSWYSDPPETDGGSWLRTTVCDCLYRAKHHMDRAAQNELAGRLEQAVQSDPLLRSATAISAVPTLPSEPFDVPHALAVSLAKRIGVPDCTSGIQKVRETTKPMKDIHEHHDKLSNIKGAFKALPAKVAGERLILIDDTIGSGVTLWAAAKALYAAGAAAIFGLTCCKNRGFR